MKPNKTDLIVGLVTGLIVFAISGAIVLLRPTPIPDDPLAWLAIIVGVPTWSSATAGTA